MKLTHTPGPTAHTIAIEGSVDTVTAPELEAAIAALPATLERLILDFAAVDYVVDYVSSAGLRVLLAADQRLSASGALVLRNVNPDVREVFEMTGFDELLTLE